jgi:ankyrin repeat protein
MLASQQGNTAIVQALLEAGADRTVRGKVAEAHIPVVFSHIVITLHFMVSTEGQQDGCRMGEDP